MSDNGLMDVVRAVQAANKALPAYQRLTVEERGRILETWAQLISARAQNLAEAVRDDLGTPLETTLASSIPEAIALIEAQVRLLHEPDDGVFRHPHGLVGVITPASNPVVCLASRVAPALAQGNAALVKPSALTPKTADLLVELATEAGLPPGLFALLKGRGADVGESLLRHPGISTISFMGSTDTGRVVAQIAAESFKRVHLSLGAKNPVIWFAGTDLADTAPKVARLCAGVHPSLNLKGSRLFIQETIFKEALELLRAEFAKLGQVPMPLKPEQRAIYDSSVALAKKENGKPLDAGNVTLFSDLTNCSTLQQDEIAGPLVLAGSFKYQHEALKHANVSPYGRVGYVFVNDSEKAEQVARRLEVGTVFLNTDDPKFDPLEEIPLLKSSGSGPEGGRSLAKFFSRETRLRNLKQS